MTDPVRDALVGLHGVRAGYDGVEVLHGIDLTVGAGEILAVLGPNGAGKSTLLSVVAGLVRPTAGTVTFGGRDLTGADPAMLAAHGVCLIPEGRGVFANLTVAENLWLAGGPTAGRRAVEERAFAVFPRLGERRGQLAGSLSGGEQQMLALSRALLVDPAVLLVDELSMGLAPLIVADLYRRVAVLAEQGVTIVLVEQFVDTVADIASRAVALVGGRIVLDGPVAQVAPELHSVYFATPEEPAS